MNSITRLMTAVLLGAVAAAAAACAGGGPAGTPTPAVPPATSTSAPAVTPTAAAPTATTAPGITPTAAGPSPTAAPTRAPTATPAPPTATPTPSLEQVLAAVDRMFQQGIVGQVTLETSELGALSAADVDATLPAQATTGINGEFAWDFTLPAPKVTKPTVSRSQLTPSISIPFGPPSGIPTPP